MLCENCTHKNVCKYTEAFEKYSNECCKKSEHADKFKVSVTCILYQVNVSNRGSTFPIHPIYSLDNTKYCNSNGKDTGLNTECGSLGG